ncbi:MAG: hypothetical protein ACXWJX_08920 [Limisphaerales bacterium]
MLVEKKGKKLLLTGANRRHVVLTGAPDAIALAEAAIGIEQDAAVHRQYSDLLTSLRSQAH